ncbi:30S ribosomal protein S5 [candidate division TM6 bacterium RIFCSPHIGHO2_12_FULL_36_22]|nr:MAG: 30S ribosomal protein S5 [candidate division TM6 bacterium RIFCSPHIGHO2_12_FULL_36_22]
MVNKKSENTEKNYVDAVISVRRVTKVTKGGKRFSFSAVVVTGDQQGNIGIAQGKSREVSSAIAKATARARKKMIHVALRGTTIPYPVVGRHGASRVVLRSAYKGTGVIAGGAMRAVMDAVGIKDILAKSIGAPQHQNVVKATLNALAQLRSASHIARLRGKTIEEITRGSHVSAS